MSRFHKENAIYPQGLGNLPEEKGQMAEGGGDFTKLMPHIVKVSCY